MAKTRRTNGGDKEDPWTGPYRFANGIPLMGLTTSGDDREPVLAKRKKGEEGKGVLRG